MSTKKILQAEVVHQGQTIVLPEAMAIPVAIEHLQRLYDYESQEVVIKENVEGFIWDAAIALQKAIERTFGWCFAEAIKSFLKSNPPEMISVEIAPGITGLVPWGRFSIPGIEGYLQTGYGRNEKGKQCLIIQATVKRVHEKAIRELAKLTRQILATESIYRSKAIRLDFSEGGVPKVNFVNLDGINEGQLVYSHDVEAAIKTSLFTPIEKSDDCRALGIPLKRGILLSGPYGTGKTLAAYVSAKKAIENGWTFIYCQKAAEFAKVVEFAKQYQPAVIFCEDIDRVTAGERSVDLDDILNIIDGIESKSTELMVVLTTNHVERINPAMLRPGRLDAVINVLPPDAEAVERLIRLYGGMLIDADVDLSAVGRELAGNIPAVIRECVERSKLAALRYAERGMPLMVTSQALSDAAASMTNQLDLLRKKAEEKSDALVLGESVAKIMRETVESGVESTVDAVKELLE